MENVGLMNKDLFLLYIRPRFKITVNGNYSLSICV